MSTELCVNPLAKRAEGVDAHVVVDPLADLLAVNHTGLSEDSEVMRNGRLLYRDRVLKIAYAHATSITRKHIEEL